MKTKQTLVCGARNLCFALAAIFALAFIACGDGSGDDKTDGKKFTVTFNSDGGSDVDAQTITKGDKAAKPADPTKAWTGTLPAGLHTGIPDSDHFDGWQKDGAAYDFDTPVTADITLTAKWTAPNHPTPPIDLSTRSEANIIAKSVAYINADDSGATAYTLALDENVDNVATIIHNKDGVTLTITSVDTTERIISNGTATGTVFVVYRTNTAASGAKLVIDGNITLQGKDNNNAAVVSVQESIHELKGNAKITGNTNTSSSNGGSNGGGGVRAEGNASNRATVTMSGNAEISGNTMGNGGGGVYLQGPADLTMSGNAAIKSNTGSGFGSGGIFAGGNASNRVTITMSGNAEISGNTSAPTFAGAIASGGGVYLSNASLTMSGNASIKNNTATGSSNAQGGGVSLTANSTFTMNGGEISGNSATSDTGTAQGGGVNIGKTAAEFIVASEAVKANIKNNTVTSTGTGTATGPQVYKNTNGVFKVGGVAADTY